MVKAWEELVERVRREPEDRQKMLAEILAEELEALDGDQRWEDLLASDPEGNERLAREATQRHERGESVEAGWDEL